METAFPTSGPSPRRTASSSSPTRASCPGTRSPARSTSGDSARRTTAACASRPAPERLARLGGYVRARLHAPLPADFLVHLVVVAAVIEVRAPGHLGARHGHLHARVQQAFDAVLIRHVVIAELRAAEPLNREQVARA